MRIKHVPYHRRDLKIAFGGDYADLDIEPLDIQIDKYAQKKIES